MAWINGAILHAALACIVSNSLAVAGTQSEVRFPDSVVDGFEEGTVPDSFGWDVALDGPWAAVADRINTGSMPLAGSIHMYRRNETGYEYSSTIHPSPAVSGAYIRAGTVKIMGNTLVFCRNAHLDFSTQPPAFTPAQPYVYEFDGTDWVFNTLLRPIAGPPGTDTTILPSFGQEIAFVDHETIALSSYIGRVGTTQPLTSAVHFFRRIGGVWQEEQLWVEGDNALAPHSFDGPMAGDQGRLVVTMAKRLRFAVFERDAGGVWNRSQIVINPQFWDTQGPEANSTHVAIDGDLIAMGQPMNTTVGFPWLPHVGTVQLFRESGGAWGYEAGKATFVL